MDGETSRDLTESVLGPPRLDDGRGESGSELVTPGLRGL